MRFTRAENIYFSKYVSNYSKASFRLYYWWQLIEMMHLLSAQRDRYPFFMLIRILVIVPLFFFYWSSMLPTEHNSIKSTFQRKIMLDCWVVKAWMDIWVWIVNNEGSRIMIRIWPDPANYLSIWTDFTKGEIWNRGNNLFRSGIMLRIWLDPA